MVENIVYIKPIRFFKAHWCPQVVNSTAAELCVACKKGTLQIAYFYKGKPGGEVL